MRGGRQGLGICTSRRRAVGDVGRRYCGCGKYQRLARPGQTATRWRMRDLRRAWARPCRRTSGTYRDFGPWSIGMASDSVQRGLRALGIQPLAPSLALLDLARRAGYIHLDAERFCRTGRGPRWRHCSARHPRTKVRRVRWTGMALSAPLPMAAVLGRSSPFPLTEASSISDWTRCWRWPGSALATTLERPIPPTAP